ncbi:hypothetical protein GCM10011529_01400 [Polymorphobacter glacialis]|uniref:PEP-CTERM sorting domain-containing protein n=1 Tax=Sandarakinorhabdus glacialis TaxID=1614636 RepID=A0A917E356_9SPHN|nr:hypothetical protein [Polymorphobacter glacialis]GGD98989.1 hypothetical protein GCM10011529_01400 [Polymorphobacter glacialis]
MRFITKISLAAVMAVAALPAAAVTIDFDTGSANTLVGGFYAAQGVTFGNAQFTGNFSLAGTSGSLAIRAPGTYVFGSGNAVTGSFTALASAI